MSRDNPPIPPRPALSVSFWALGASCLCHQVLAALTFSLAAERVLVAAQALFVATGVLVACVLVAHLTVGLQGQKLTCGPVARRVGARSRALRGRGGRTSRRIVLHRQHSPVRSQTTNVAQTTDVAQTVLVLVVVSLMSCGLSLLCGARQLEGKERLCGSAVSGWTLTIVSDPSVGAYGFRSRARARRDPYHGASCDVWVTSREQLDRGVTIRCVGRFKQLPDNDYGHTSWAQGVCGSVTVLHVLERHEPHGLWGVMMRVRGRAQEALGRPDAPQTALLVGCVCGKRTQLDEQGLVDEFARCGLAHLIAVSGAHLAIVTALMGRALSLLRLRVPARVVLLALVTGLYVAFCGAPPSAVRAWAMSLVSCGAQVAGRRAYGASSVCLVALVMVLCEPSLSSQMGFQLSVLSVLGLSLFLPYVSYAVQVAFPNPALPRRFGYATRRTVHKALDGARAVVCVTLVCQLVTLPVTAGAFQTISLVSPMANLLVSPLFAPLVTLGVLSCALDLVGLPGGALMLASRWVASLMLWVVHALSDLPYACVSLALVPMSVPPLLLVVLLAILVTWPVVSGRLMRRALLSLALCLALVLAKWRYGSPARIVVLDIGQGDAILVQDGRSAILVDAGPDDSVVKALARRHVLHLDAVVITHLHDDHYGGVEHLAGMVPCSCVVVAQGVAEAMDQELLGMCMRASGHEPYELAYGDVIRVGGFSIKMIWPTHEVDGDENCESIELAVSYERDGASLAALLTGDAERDETGMCIRNGDVGDIDLLKVGHHGSDVSITQDEAQALLPEVSVASAGEGNSYGHPSPVCVKTLQEAGSYVLCTKDVGDVEVLPGSTGPMVITHPHATGQYEAPVGL